MILCTRENRMWNRDVKTCVKVTECLKSYSLSQIGQTAAATRKMMQNDPLLHLPVGETVSGTTALRSRRLESFMLAEKSQAGF